MPLQRLAMDTRDERIKEVILVLLLRLSRTVRLKWLYRHHRPANRNGRAGRIHKTECIETIVCAVIKPGRHRMAFDNLHRSNGFRMSPEKSLHLGRIGFTSPGIRT